jgi:single-stranded-DNA-specific exonuclease
MQNGASLIITLDCGIKSIDHISYATEKGIDFIICDHHTVGDEIPKAHAILNPKQKDCSYPYKELSGCGIGYKLVAAYSEFAGIPWQAEEYLDLVAISIAADIVHMTGENRTITFHGLKKINTSPRPGVEALIRLAGIKKDLVVNDLVFRIGPRINAAGRITTGALAVSMLTEDSVEKAREIADQINQNNTDRQEVDQSITKEALAMIEELHMTHRKSTVLFNKNWHKGVIGIVASRLIEKYYRPTVLLTESNGYAVGSARSVPGYDLYAAIKMCGDLLEQWGGHQAAAGLTMPLENVEAFREKFEEAVNLTITEDQLTPLQEYDMEIELDDITPSFCKSIERFGPFGPENMKPVFITRGLYCNGRPRIVGNNHLQFNVISPTGVEQKAIAFGMGEYGNIIAEKAFDICYTVEPNEFRGVYMVSLNIKDIHFDASL